MKKLFFCLGLYALLSALQSCKKKDTTTPDPTPSPAAGMCLVKTMTLDSVPFLSFEFDANNRVAAFNNGFIGNHSQITYTGATITTKEYNSNNVLLTTTLEYLNSDQYIETGTSQGIDTLYGSNPVARNMWDTATYQYDAAKYLLKEIHKKRTVEIVSGKETIYYDTTYFTVQNENVTHVLRKIHSVSTSGTSVQTNDNTYTFGNDLNTSGQVQSPDGVFLSPFSNKGKKSKNRTLTESSIGGSPQTISYTLNSSAYIITEQNSWGNWAYIYYCY